MTDVRIFGGNAATSQAGRPAEIVAAQVGVVHAIRAGETGYGNYVRVRHEWADGATWVTWYAHLSSINPALQVGDIIELYRREKSV